MKGKYSVKYMPNGCVRFKYYYNGTDELSDSLTVYGSYSVGKN